MMNYDGIYEIIKNYKYVSFDIFDTLLKRNVLVPSDVFNIVAIKYEKRYGQKIVNFKDIRIKAEKDAYKNKASDKVYLKDIYNKMDKLDKDTRRILYELELEVELEVSQVNYDIKPIYEYCLKNSKTVLLISDMYLDDAFIKELLFKNGIVGYKRLYVSSSIGCTKRSGKLYKYVIRDMKIDKNSLVHLGDNKKSDYNAARINGIKSILIPERINRLRYYKLNNNSLEESILTSFINNNLIKDHDSVYFQMGYEFLGILLYGYSKWLREECEKDGINKIYFMAREGYLLEKAFEMLNNGFECHYLYVSRRSLTVPILHMCTSLKEVTEKLTYRNGETIGEYLSKICDQKVEKIGGEDINLKLNVRDFLNSINEKQEEVCLNLIHKVSLIEKNNLIEYLKYYGVEGRFAASDVGWKGTIQERLSDILKIASIQNDIHGYYIGKEYGYLWNEENKKFYIQKENGDNWDLELLPSFIALVEILFNPNEGSTKKYECNNMNEYYPVMEVREDDKSYSIIQGIQNGAIQFLQDFKVLVNDLDINIDKNLAIEGINKLTTKPTLSDVQALKDLKYYSENDYKNLLCKNRSTYYLIKPKEALREFKDSDWKIGYLKSLIRFRLPYNRIMRIINLLYKIINKRR